MDNICILVGSQLFGRRHINDVMGDKMKCTASPLISRYAHNRIISYEDDESGIKSLKHEERTF